MISREEIKKFAKISGADIFGIANIERFSDLPPERNPLSIFPETKSVIVVGRRIVRGAIRGVEEGTNFMNYQVYGYNWLENRFLALTTYKIASFIENKGWEAVPLPNLPPEIPPMGISVRENQPPPNSGVKNTLLHPISPSPAMYAAILKCIKTFGYGTSGETGLLNSGLAFVLHHGKLFGIGTASYPSSSINLHKFHNTNGCWKKFIEAYPSEQ